MLKIIILGSQGMLGRYISSYLKKIYADGLCTIIEHSRSTFDIVECVKTGTFPDLKGSVVINCAGIINKRDDLTAEDLLRESIIANSIFPHIMAKECKDKGAIFVHITTDCVFDGAKGNYSIMDKHDAKDIYGVTKSCGEPSPNECILIRSSIIGESSNGRSLVEWLRLEGSKGDAKITGYTNHRWNGVTCLELAKTIYEILSRGVRTGLFVVTSPEPVTKYELCKKIAEAYRWKICIDPGRGSKDIDRSLVGNVVRNKTIDEQIEEMVKFSL